MAGDAVRIMGKELRCQHCGHGRFADQQIELDRVFGTSWIWFKWWESLANVYVCERCGFLHWFYTAKDPVPEIAQPELAQLDGGGQQDVNGHDTEDQFEAAAAEENERAEDTECLSCGKVIPAGADKCAACGWSWDTATQKSD